MSDPTGEGDDVDLVSALAGQFATDPVPESDEPADANFALGGGDGAIDQRLIDSMLGFTAGGFLPDGPDGVRALTQPPAVPHERLPVLETVFEHLVSLLRGNMRYLTSENVEVALDRMNTVRFGNYMTSIPLPAILAIVKADPWEDFCILQINSDLIFAFIDVLLGRPPGAGAPVIEGRPYTTIELGLIRKIAELILKTATDAFRPISPVSFIIDHVETNPRFANIARPASKAILARFFVDIGGHRGMFELLLPHATLEPVRDVLLQDFIGEKLGRDAAWEEHLATEIFSAEVELSAVLYEGHVPLRQVMDLRIGQTLLFEAPPDHPVEVRCHSHVLAQGRLGRADDAMAVQVSSAIRSSRTTLAQFAGHGRS